MHNPVLPPNRTNSVERRRHPRHSFKSFSTVVVQLGPNNGGNLLDISGGGLSLQAVARLLPEVELTLRFRLQGMAQAIETVGRVTWLGPTQKVAGISFTNLADITEQQIVEWVTSQEPSPQIDPSSHSNAVPLSSSSISPHRISRVEPQPLPTPSLSVSQYEINPQKKIVLPLHKSLESLAENSKPVLETITLSTSAAALSSRRSVSLDPSLISRDETYSKTYLRDSSARDLARESSASESRRRRRKFMIAVAAVILGISVLLEVTPQGRGWIDRAKIFLGIGAAAQMDPAKATVPVWAVPANRFYYCANDPNFHKLEPGGMTTQGEALQNAYKPSHGYCQ